MVRRRKTNLGDKESNKKPKNLRKDATLVRWDKRDDIPLDDEERFHADKDKILLEGAHSGDDDDDLGDRNEVFALKGLQQDNSDDDAEDEEEEDSYAFEDGYDEEYKESQKKASQSKAARELSRLRAEEHEDDEGLAEDLDAWGTKQSEYYTGGLTQFDDEKGSLDSEDERNEREEEEQEVKRLQGKMREEIGEEDYGLADGDGVGGDEGAVDFLGEDDPVEKVHHQAKDKKTLLKELEVKSPETLALAREWEDIAYDVVRVDQALQRKDPEDPSIGLMNIHYQTLLTYATLVAFYLHLRASTQYAARPETLSTHPIMARLLQLKTALTELEGLGFSALSEDVGSSDSDDDDDDEGSDVGLKRLGRISRDELEALMRDINVESQEEDDDDDDDDEDDDESDKSEDEAPVSSSIRLPKTSLPPPTFDLAEPTFESNRVKKSKASVRSRTLGDGGDDDFGYGDPLSLPQSDLSDKTQRRRDLKFHTQKIERKTRTREKARMGRIGVGGDDDLPYATEELNRRKAKKTRDLAQEGWGDGDDGNGTVDVNNVDLGAKKRTWGEAKPELNGLVSKKKRPRKDGSSSESEERDPTTEYLELVRGLKRQKKDDKRAVWDAAEEDKRAEALASQSPGSGPRSLTNSILKNKGLTRQRRRKDQANPRLKKAAQYEKAKKKLATTKAVYKGGLSATAGVYEGEKSGISSNVIRGVKF
ncbi:hypothetical protein FRB97_001823 [Tulasnella sp. 331]|nr:hypothetical protein FRB98_008009 [Tulasnella sp. 332]KAG8879239.1 hypothetical protein FRB97_001823 [Tulasnella sp. 331]